MNSFLLNRQLGSISPKDLATAQNNRLLRSLQPASDVTFELQAPDGTVSDDDTQHQGRLKGYAHAVGVSSITIDRFEGRYLLSSGADSSVAIWDLEAAPLKHGDRLTHLPLGHVARTSTTESLGVNHVSYYPFDSLAFLTSGYDRTLKLFSSETLTASATFDLGNAIYSHSVSAVASHLLVACASQHPAVRLVDLRSGSSTHSLAGHSGAALAVSWHPKDENILVSGATDGTIRVWDVRRSASSLGVLDMEDSIGIAGYDRKGTGARRREKGKSHNAAVNGMAWTSKGQYLVSVGHDERMRVWDMAGGANTLANFGPGLRNTQNTALYPVLAPSHLSPTGTEIVYFPNPREILSFDLHTGSMLSRLRTINPQGPNSDAGSRNVIPRTTSLAWRAHSIELYSAHADGAIRCWQPRTREDVELEREDEETNENAEAVADRKRKREELDQIVRDLTKQRTTYS